MSFLKKLFGRRMPDKMEYVKVMAEMAAESERTYRGMIETYNSDVELGMLSVPSGSTVLPTGRGIYKARLFGALFMAIAYTKSARSEVEKEEMLSRSRVKACRVSTEKKQSPSRWSTSSPHLKP